MLQRNQSSQRKLTGLFLCLLMAAPALVAEEWGNWPCLYKRGYIESNVAQESPVNIGQLQPGAPLPDLTAYTSAGEPVSLNQYFKQKPTVLFFYKSAYCGHCQFQFMQILGVQDQLADLGFQVMAVSHVSGENTRRMEDKYTPPFPVLSDRNQDVGRALGIASSVARPEVNFYPGRNDMGVYGSALFVVSTNGRVLYEWTYNDNKVRLNDQAVLAAARKVIADREIVFGDLQAALRNPDSVTHLNLNYQNLKTVPDIVFRLKNLEHLEWVGNHLEALPPQIGQLTNLRHLNLSNNQLRSLPSEIGQLTRLQDLQLLKNNLTHLPPEIGALTNLVRLNLMYNPVAELPSEIGGLASLKYLRLFEHHLDTLPPEIGQLKNLRNFLLIGKKAVPEGYKPVKETYAHWLNPDLPGPVTGLKMLPPEIGDLENLFELHLLYNELETLPPEIGNLKNLQFIHLANNRLTSLPPEFAQLDLAGYRGTEGLYLWKNRLSTLPDSVAAMDLVYLYLDYNRFTFLPEALLKNQHLQRVYINHNNLKIIPAIEMPRLMDISFRYNQLTTIPSIRQETVLHSLDLSHNSIASLGGLGEALRIRHLLLNHNKITQLPAGLPEAWASLTKLELRGNPLDPQKKSFFEENWLKTREKRGLKLD